MGMSGRGCHLQGAHTVTDHSPAGPVHGVSTEGDGMSTSAWKAVNLPISPASPCPELALRGRVIGNPLQMRKLRSERLSDLQ